MNQFTGYRYLMQSSEPDGNMANQNCQFGGSQPYMFGMDTFNTTPSDLGYVGRCNPNFSSDLSVSPDQTCAQTLSVARPSWSSLDEPRPMQVEALHWRNGNGLTHPERTESRHNQRPCTPSPSIPINPSTPPSTFQKGDDRELFQQGADYIQRVTDAEDVLAGSVADRIRVYLMERSNHSATLQEVYMGLRFKYTSQREKLPESLQNSVRHNLSLNKGFVKGLPRNTSKWRLTEDAFVHGVRSTTSCRNDRKKPAGEDFARKSQDSETTAPRRPVRPRAQQARGNQRSRQAQSRSSHRSHPRRKDPPAVHPLSSMIPSHSKDDQGFGANHALQWRPTPTFDQNPGSSTAPFFIPDPSNPAAVVPALSPPSPFPQPSSLWPYHYSPLTPVSETRAVASSSSPEHRASPFPINAVERYGLRSSEVFNNNAAVSSVSSSNSSASSSLPAPPYLLPSSFHHSSGDGGGGAGWTGKAKGKRKENTVVENGGSWSDQAGGGQAAVMTMMPPRWGNQVLTQFPQEQQQQQQQQQQYRPPPPLFATAMTKATESGTDPRSGEGFSLEDLVDFDGFPD